MENYSQDNFREKLGGRLVLWSTVALVVLAIIIMIAAGWDEKERSKTVLATAQLLLTALLPLFGTWIGTVLAFYYTKENFEAASRNTLNAVKTTSERLASTFVSDVMMHKSNMIVIQVEMGKGIGDLTIAQIQQAFDSVTRSGQRISRLPILNNADECIAILHRSVFDEMLAANAKDASPIDVKTAKISPLLIKKHPSQVAATYQSFIENTIGFVSEKATLAEAKREMEILSGCQDIMITKMGRRNEPVLGWLSNVDIGRLSKA